MSFPVHSSEKVADQKPCCNEIQSVQRNASNNTLITPTKISVETQSAVPTRSKKKPPKPNKAHTQKSSNKKPQKPSKVHTQESSNHHISPHAPKIPSAPHTVCKSYHEKNNVTFEELWTYPRARILIGIFSTATKFKQRYLIRTLYRSQQKRLKDDWVDFKFIIGTPPPEEDSKSLRLNLRLEQESFDDVVMLNITENLNKGKIYEYYKWAGETFTDNSVTHYDFIGKADDDEFVHFQNLALNLRPLSRKQLYYGYYLPHGTEWGYMTGMLEILSTDLVSWIATSDIPGTHKYGPEDVVLGRWLAMSKFPTDNYISENCLLSEDPRSRSRNWLKQKFVSPHLVAIHGLKEAWKWEAVIDLYLT